MLNVGGGRVGTSLVQETCETMSGPRKHPDDDGDDSAGPEFDVADRGVVLTLAVFFEVGLAPFSLFFGWLTGHPPLETFAWALDDALWGVVVAAPLIGLFLMMIAWPIGPLARVQRFCQEEIVPLFEQSRWPEFALISISAGVGEEMLFRGFLQASFMGWIGLTWGLLAASALFGLLHPISITYIAIVTVLGIYFGTVWLVNGNLLTVMVAHALYDFAALELLVRARFGARSEGP